LKVTVCYITNRLDPKIHWFLDSLRLQIKPEDEVNVIVVDFYAEDRPLQFDGTLKVLHVTPKPNVWQGKHRLTKDHWFAASNARNTGLCLCHTDWIAYVDDLSVLWPSWLDSVRQSYEKNYIALGAYKKVKSLVVENGYIISFDAFPQGTDSRLKHGGEVISCGGDWLYGCSLAGPTEAFLTVNGWPETHDGMGFEDSCMGICIGNTNKFSFRYDKRMLTLESEDHHGGKDYQFKHTDFGISPKDKSHALLNIAKASKWFPNYFEPDGIRGLRDRVLRGEPFPIQQNPRHEFFTGRPLTEL
jgi:hypothetical protein